MHKEIKSYLDYYRKIRNTNIPEWVNTKTTKLNTYMKTNGLSSCIVGCSGGIDSSVTFALCKLAQQQEDSPIKHVVPVLLPMRTNKSSNNRAIELCQHFKTTPMVDTIGLQALRMKEDTGNSFHTWLNTETSKQHKLDVSDFAYGQLQSYLRTPHLYFTAQMMSQYGFPAIVMGTGNKDEDGYLAYFCKAGDGVVDVQLINDLHKSEVYDVGHFLKLPKSILDAKPTADLWEGQTDEDEIGVSYDYVEFVTGFALNLTDDEYADFIGRLTPDAYTEYNKSLEICQTIHNKNKHKLNGIINL